MGRTGLAIGLAALLLAACSSGSTGESAATTQTSTNVAEGNASSTTPTTFTSPEITEPRETTEPVEAARAQWTDADWAESALLTLDDLPADWTEEPYDPASEADNDETNQMISECAGVEFSLLEGDLATAEANTGDFESPDGSTSVSQALRFFADEAAALEVIAAFTDDDYATCAEEAVMRRWDASQSSDDPAETIPAGLVLTDVTMERLDLADIADPTELAGYQVVLSYEHEGQELGEAIHLFRIRDRRMVSSLQFYGNGQLFPSELLEELLTMARKDVWNTPQSPNEVALLTLDDFGYLRMSPLAKDEDSLWAMVASCMGVDPALVSDDILGDTEVTSGEIWTADEHLGVSHSVGQAADESTAIAATAALDDERLADCYEKAFRADFEASKLNDPEETPPSVTLEEVQVIHQDASRLGADGQTVWYAVDWTYTLDGFRYNPHNQLIFLRDGRSLARLQFMSYNGPFPRDQVKDLVDLASDRLAAIDH